MYGAVRSTIHTNIAAIPSTDQAQKQNTAPNKSLAAPLASSFCLAKSFTTKYKKPKYRSMLRKSSPSCVVIERTKLYIYANAVLPVPSICKMLVFRWTPLGGKSSPTCHVTCVVVQYSRNKVVDIL